MCASCQQGKSKKLPFPTPTSRASRPLELAHSDVWGLSPISSISGFRFYVLFVDDFSRYCSLYPLCNKSEVYIVFISFKAQVENLLDNKIKILRSDGGGEYTSHLLKKFLSTCGITHQISFPHTPEQNGISERKHRRIIETGITLLAHSQMPAKYWLEAFNAAIFLINRMPIKILSNVSPWETLFSKPPEYKFLRVFGCICFPWLRP